MVTAEPRASDQLWETHFPEAIAEGWGPRAGSVCVLGKEAGGGAPRWRPYLPQDLWNLDQLGALRLYFEDWETGPERCHQLLKVRAV